MREKSALRTQAVDNGQRVSYGRMRRVRLMPQCIEKQNVEAFEFMHRGLGNFAVVSEVGGRAEAISVNLALAVNQNDRLEAHAENVDGAVDGTELQQRQPAEFVIRVKNVGEHPAQKRGGFGPSIQGKLLRLVLVTQRPQIINAQDVVGMRMGIEDRVNPSDVFADCLRVKIGSGIDQYDFAVLLDHDRRPGAPVVRIDGVAN